MCLSMISLAIVILFSVGPSVFEEAYSLGDIGDPFAIGTLSPLEQFSNGTPANKVVCSSGLELVIKAEDHSPACVTSDTLGYLVARGWALKPQEKIPVYFVKLNSTGHILVEYYSNLGFAENLVTRLYSNESMYPVYQSGLAISVSPDTIYGYANTTVIYTITAKGDARGMYWLALDACRFIPIAVGLDSSQVTDSHLVPVISGWRCPVSLFNYKVILVDGISVEYK